MAIPPVGWTGDFNMLSGTLVEGWYTTTGPTETAMTGPDVPADGTHFAYMESSGPAPSNSTFSIQTPLVSIPIVGTTALNLSFLMYGSDIGSLTIEVLQGPSTDVIFARSGPQHPDGSLSSWEEISLDLTDYAGTSARIQFTGMKQINNLADIGLDEIVVCHTPARVPTLGTWALISLALCLTTFAVVSLLSRPMNMSI